MSAIAEHCEVTGLIMGECDKEAWSILLWTCALLPSNIKEEVSA